MAQEKQGVIANPSTTSSKPKSRVGHWVRIIVSIISFGFVFPHSFTEDDDIAK
jgi:hypothetical protein